MKNDIFKKTQRRCKDRFKSTLAERLTEYDQCLLSRKQLFEIYEPELNSLRNAKNRDYAEVHFSIRDKVEFLRLVILKIGPRPSAQHSLDRLNNAKYVYHPNFLAWATPKDQARNRQSTRTLHAVDPKSSEVITLTLPEWSDRQKLSLEIIHKRLSEGWTPEQTVFIPKGGRRCNYELEASTEPQSVAHNLIQEGVAEFSLQSGRHVTSEERAMLKPALSYWVESREIPRDIIWSLFDENRRCRMWQFYEDQNIKYPLAPRAAFIRRYRTDILQGYRVVRAHEKPCEPAVPISWKQL